MIDKNFYLENLSAFDILIQDDREKAQEVIFRVFSILQRDKIWLREVATEEEIIEEDAELLEEVEEELKELDLKYDFRFEEFYQRVQLELKKIQSTSNQNFEVDEEMEDDEDLYDEDPDLYDEDEENNFEDEDDDDLYGDDDSDALSHISDEDLDQITDYILESAKSRFDYAEFLNRFPQADEIFVEEQILFPIIAGKAHEETEREIAAKMQSAFVTLGFQVKSNDLEQMIEQKGKELGLEILAFGIAADSLQQGAHPTAVLDQISLLLKR